MKQIFFEDRPRLLHQIIGGKAIQAFVSTDLPKTIERRADLALLVDPDELHHLEFQSNNFGKLPYRQGVTCFLLAERYPKCRIIQTVIYFGDAPLRMKPGIDVGAASVHYRVIDIREFDSLTFLDGSPADLVLAVLARGGRENLKLILDRIYGLNRDLRSRTLTHIAMLAGLRRIAGPFTMEIERMGLTAEIRNNPFLQSFYQDAVAEGLEQTRRVLRVLLEAKFGRLPVWAERAVRNASAADLERLALATNTAPSLKLLFGRK